MIYYISVLKNPLFSFVHTKYNITYIIYNNNYIITSACISGPSVEILFSSQITIFCFIILMPNPVRFVGGGVGQCLLTPFLLDSMVDFILTT